MEVFVALNVLTSGNLIVARWLMSAYYIWPIPAVLESLWSPNNAMARRVTLSWVAQYKNLLPVDCAIYNGRVLRCNLQATVSHHGPCQTAPACALLLLSHYRCQRWLALQCEGLCCQGKAREQSTSILVSRVMSGLLPSWSFVASSSHAVMSSDTIMLRRVRRVARFSWNVEKSGCPLQIKASCFVSSWAWKQYSTSF